MKVLHLLSSNKYSGAENVACQIISLFNDEKNDFAYCSPDGEIKESVENRNIKFIPLKKMSVKEIKRVIKQFNPDIIHAHDMKAICLALLAKSKCVVGQIHRNHDEFKKLSIRSLIFKFFASKKALKKIIWVSPDCLNDYKFKKSVENKSIILTNIVNAEEHYKKATANDDIVTSDITFVGRLTDIKNPLRLVDITKLVVKKLPDAQCNIIGTGELEQELKAEIEKNSLQNNIHLLGFKCNPFPILSKSKIFLLTSKSEGLPMCLLEAQAFGLPVVCPQIAGLEKIVTNKTGCLYSSDEQAANFIINLLKDDKKYLNYNKDILAFSKQYNDASNFKTVLLSIYNESLKG